MLNCTTCTQTQSHLDECQYQADDLHKLLDIVLLYLTHDKGSFHIDLTYLGTDCITLLQTKCHKGHLRLQAL